MKVDFGCGPNKKEGFIGVDRIPFKGIDHVVDIGHKRLPFKDNSVDEGHASHFIEHLTATERIHFCNELYRVLKPDATCTIIVPAWKSNRAYGDPTHQWPPISEMWFAYLKKDWRDTNAPHTDRKHWNEGYSCDFDATWGYSLHPMLATRNTEFQTYAINFYLEAAQDIHATLIKRMAEKAKAKAG